MDDTTKDLTDDALMDDAEDGDGARRVAEIRSEIQEARAEMAETIEAIQERLQPRAIVARTAERVKESTAERLRAAAGTTSETVRAMADSAGDTAQDVWARTRSTAGGVMDVIRDHPLPTALIGLGAAWLLVSASRRREPDGRYESDEFDEFAATRRRDDGLHRSQLTSDARDYANETGDSIRRAGRRAQRQLTRMTTDSPLLVGAGALMIGAAFGLAFRETEPENALMGQARDSIVDGAERMASDAATRLEQTAADVADIAGDVAGSISSHRQS